MLQSQFNSLDERLSQLVVDELGRHKVVFVKECDWILDGSQLDRFKALKISETMDSDIYELDLSNGGRLRFYFQFQRATRAFRNNVFFRVGIKSLSKGNRVSACWSLSVPEINYVRNKCRLFGLRIGNNNGYMAFSNKLITSKIKQLSVSVAIRFE